ncbi:DUF4253 domain-containing protein [Flavobacterium sp. I-SCBP12n]|uniref:DUF4253 domain-containing protein n=1 Tax=Flavobacterium pygoscelis TaxID=2893176 RepID=A0A9X2BRA9_9FLAO|nr:MULTISPECIES: DUF4253 domain-containing protein [Flavobacterium]MCK8143336.1 DUF4253 domain-containing protein [Flavobacterium pygoscelis]
MKAKLILLTMGIFSFFGCSNKTELTKTEESIITKLNFDKSLVLELKAETTKNIFQLPAIDSDTGEELDKETFEGIYSESNEKDAEKLVRKLKQKFKEKGYLIFYLEGLNGKKNIGIIKGIDELDILRYRKTDGINYDLESEDVLKKISEWNTKFGVKIIGCNQDYIQIEFDKLPQNMEEFAKEVYAFCPDSVDQGVGDIKSLEEYIKQDKGIWLWWD